MKKIFIFLLLLFPILIFSNSEKDYLQDVCDHFNSLSDGSVTASLMQDQQKLSQYYITLSMQAPSHLSNHHPVDHIRVHGILMKVVPNENYSPDHYVSYGSGGLNSGETGPYLNIGPSTDFFTKNENNPIRRRKSPGEIFMDYCEEVIEKEEKRLKLECENRTEATIASYNSRLPFTVDEIYNDIYNQAKENCHNNSYLQILNLKKVINNKLVREQPPTGILPCFHGHSLIQNEHLQLHDGTEVNQFNCMLACHENFIGTKIAEVAQIGIESLQASHVAQTQEEFDYLQYVTEQCYKFLDSPHINRTSEFYKPTPVKSIKELHDEAITITRELDPDDPNYERELQREEALHISLNQESYTQSIQIDAKTEGFLKAHDMSSRQFAYHDGFAINHQLTQELLQLVDQSAEFASNHHQAIDYFVTTAQLAVFAQDVNSAGKIEQAMKLTDATHGIFDYSKAIVVGFGNGCYNIGEFFCNVAMHPIDTTVEIIEGVSQAAYWTFVAIEELATLAHYSLLDDQRYYDQTVKIGNVIDFSKQALRDYWQNNSGPQKVQDATTFFTEIFLPAKAGKVLSSLHKTLAPGFAITANFVKDNYKKLPRKVLRTVMSEEQIYETLSLTEKTQVFMQDAQKTAQKGFNGAAAAFSSRITLPEAQTATKLLGNISEITGIRQIEEFRSITKNFTDISQLAQHEIAYLNICQWFYPQYLELSQKLESLNLSIKYNGQVHQIKSWGLYHSLIGDLRPLTGRYCPSGAHCNFEGLLESFFYIENEKQMANNFTYARLRNVRKKSFYKDKTLFPRSWTPKQCVEAVIDVIQNSQEIIQPMKNQPHLFRIKGNNNFIFDICISNKGNITFYPYSGTSL